MLTTRYIFDLCRMTGNTVIPCTKWVPVAVTRVALLAYKLLYHVCLLHTHTHLTALCPGLPGWAGTGKTKPIWILLKQETVSGSGVSWAICKSAPCSRQITMPTPHHSVFYRLDALPAAQPTVSKHWRLTILCIFDFIAGFEHGPVRHLPPEARWRSHHSVARQRMPAGRR